MFKKIVEFFTGKKPETKFAHPLDAVTKSNPGHPGWPIPVPQAPYKLEPPVDATATTPLPYIPPVAVPISPEPAPAKKPRKAAAPKPVVAKTPAKSRAKKTPE
jgi:hypothetical protein